jgi:hypothetical protein
MRVYLTVAISDPPGTLPKLGKKVKHGPIHA